jgi:tetratricopeptide (TPR) repeat protein
MAERSKEEPANDCVRCHMPRRGVAGIPHSDDASHRIVRLPGQPFPDSAFETSDPDVPGLVVVNRRGADKRKPVSPLVKLRAYSDIMGLKKLPEAAKHYVDLLAELRQTHPDDPIVLMCLGRKAVADGDNGAAVDYLTRALERGGTFDTTYMDLANALIKLDRKPEAARVLEKGVAMWPFSADLQQALVLCYMSMQSYSQARRALEHYVALFPEDAIAREGLARARAAGD